MMQQNESALSQTSKNMNPLWEYSSIPVTSCLGESPDWTERDSREEGGREGWHHRHHLGVLSDVGPVIQSDGDNCI